MTLRFAVAGDMRLAVQPYRPPPAAPLWTETLKIASPTFAVAPPTRAAAEAAASDEAIDSPPALGASRPTPSLRFRQTAS